MENKTDFDRGVDEGVTKVWEIIFKLWHSKKVQFFLDVCRILTFILLIYIIYTLVTEIEIIKILGSNVCEVCMEKTGCECWCLN